MMKLLVITEGEAKAAVANLTGKEIKFVMMKIIMLDVTLMVEIVVGMM